MDQSKTVQARITKSSLSAVWKTLGSGTVKLFTSNEGAKWEREVEKNLRFLANIGIHALDVARNTEIYAPDIALDIIRRRV